MPLWGILIIIGAVVAYFANSALGSLLIFIGIVVLLVDLFDGRRA